MSPLTHTSIEMPAHGWTPERKAQFLDRLSAHGNARAACRSVGLSAESAYKLRRRDPLFARAWAAAVVLGRDNSIEALAERAIDGVEEPIYYRGELVGTRRRYDSRLLLAHLARLDQLAEEVKAGEDAGRFDELLACIAERTEAELPPAREAYLASAGESAAANLREEHLERYPSLYSDECPDPLMPPGYLTDEENRLLDELEEECSRAREDARREAEREWDRYRAAVNAEVDALCDLPPGPIQPGLPGHPLAARAKLAVADNPRGKEQGSRHFDGPTSFVPCTPSTASTTALGTALAD